MNIRILDFGILTKHYNKYQQAVLEIEAEKTSFMKDIKILQEKLNTLIKEDSNDYEVMLINQEIVIKEKDFKYKIKLISDDANVICYDEISKIVQEWALKNDIDLILSSNEVVFSKKGIDSTNEILDIFKSRDLFVD